MDARRTRCTGWPVGNGGEIEDRVEEDAHQSQRTQLRAQMWPRTWSTAYKESHASVDERASAVRGNTPTQEWRPHQDGEPWQEPYSSPAVTQVASGEEPSGDTERVIEMSKTQLCAQPSAA